MKEPALGMIEFKSIARGIFACDAMVKKAPVRIIETHPVCPGKYLTMICGEVADVEEAQKAGLEAGRDMVVADLFLARVHPAIIPALAGTNPISEYGAVGILESFAVATLVRAADIAAKTTPIQLIELRLANGLGGKAYFVLTGTLADVEISLQAAKEFVKSEGMLAGCELIPAPHPDLVAKGLYW